MSPPKPSPQRREGSDRPAGIPRATLTPATAPAPGAVGILQLHGPDAFSLIEQLTTRPAPPPGRVAVRRLADIDDGVVVIGDAPGGPWAQLMPHGGPRVMRKLIDALIDLGAAWDQTPDARTLYPEADSPIEADALAAIARAPSPAAIDLLAAQPRLWRAWFKAEKRKSGKAENPDCLDFPLFRFSAFPFLLSPPTVAVIGRANVGKSTLTNALLGKAVSIVADLPGTTRDWVGSLVELQGTRGLARQGVAVQWLDTPGLRDSDDPVEQRAIEVARRVIEQAQVLIALRDPQADWPDAAALPREPDLWVMNKCDDAEGRAGIRTSCAGPLPVSAKADRGLDALADAVLDHLGLLALSVETPWPFTEPLNAIARGAAGEAAIQKYLYG